MHVPTCSGFKPDGSVCKSPTLRGQRFCYFHLDPAARSFKAAWARALIALRVAKEKEHERRRRTSCLELAR